MPKLWILTTMPACWVLSGSAWLQRGVQLGHMHHQLGTQFLGPQAGLAWLVPSLLSSSWWFAGLSWPHPSAVRAQPCSPLKWTGLHPAGDTDREKEKSWGKVQKVPQEAVEGEGSASTTGQGEGKR